MPARGSVQGVMFDAGGVLIRPVGGRWNPRYDFEAVVLAHAPDTATDLFPAAVATGDRFLAADPGTAVRSEYHRAMLRVLGIEHPSRSLLEELEAPAAGPALELFPDVLRTLDALRRRGVRMCVVSDAWADLTGLLTTLGIAAYFEEIVISEVVGCTKPDPRMYEAGRRSLDLPAGRCLFVDDDASLVRAAADLGFPAVTLDRNRRSAPTEKTITTLDDVPALVHRARTAGDSR